MRMEKRRVVAYLFPCGYSCKPSVLLSNRTRRCHNISYNHLGLQPKQKQFSLKHRCEPRVLVTMEEKTKFTTTDTKGDSVFMEEQDSSKKPVWYSEDSDIYVDLTESPNFQVKPAGAVSLAWLHFRKELGGLVRSIGQSLGWIERDEWTPPDCYGFRLDNDRVLEMQKQRESEQSGRVSTNKLSRWIYDVLCSFIDFAYKDRPIERFWFLETVARMPYFSYISVLHLYETLGLCGMLNCVCVCLGFIVFYYIGWWRNGELLKIHFAEEYNEFHHLLIMESLGGSRKWLDRFLAEHAAVFYYWVLVLFFFLSPSLAYNFSELIEAHAVDTYTEFLRANEDLLKQLPPPKIAESYYLADNLYMFDEFQNHAPGTRRPPCDSLYDVFCNIRDDEMEHVKVSEKRNVIGWLNFDLLRRCTLVRVTQSWEK